VLGAGLSFAASPNWGVALLIIGLMAAVWAVWYLLQQQINDCKRSHQDCKDEVQDLLDRLFNDPNYEGPRRRAADVLSGHKIAMHGRHSDTDQTEIKL
jgi:hypothetical protein